MKRVIKFRAYTEISNEVLGMKYDVPHTYNDTVMQFTGLLDRNGKEIYEADVVISPNYQYDPSNGDDPVELSEVRFVDGAFIAGDYCLREFELQDTEVIGNIYENPELLN